jgi:hypothetical protein
VLFIVIAWPIALCGVSGATTTISPSSAITDINARIPGAETPSSFVIKIKGLFFFISNMAKKGWFYDFDGKCNDTEWELVNKR